MPSIQYDHPQGEQDFQRYGEIAAATFVFPPERAALVFDAVGRQNVRVVRVDGQVAGGMLVTPMGQYFGGKSVPMLGIALVAVAPELRAAGVALELMRAGLRESHAAGGVISTLYPATQTLYRRAGYEQAGTQFSYSLPLGGINLRESARRVRPVVASDDAALRRAYAVWAAQHPGMLDRNEYIWRRVYELRGEKAQGYVVEHDGVIEGYLFYFQRAAAPVAGMNLPIYTLHLTDFVAHTPESTRCLLAFLASHRSLVSTVHWSGPPNEPALGCLAEFTATIALRWNWMIRIVNVPQALAARGYPPSLSAELHLRVQDDLLTDNTGQWLLRIQHGEPRVERGGRGEIEVDIRGLASLYSGYAGPAALVAQGKLRGPAGGLQSAAEVFGGPLPWMRDMF